MRWSEKVSPDFVVRLTEIAGEIGIDADWLAACISFETGGTFSPSIRNAAGSGAVGLIQFMPSTAIRLGTTTEALAALTAVEQLEYVRKYFLPYKGRLTCLEDVYMTILWPAAVGKPLNYPIFSQETRPKTYAQNRGLDIDGDGVVTKFEACAKVRKIFEQPNGKED